MVNYILTNSKPCAAVVLLLSLSAAALGCIFLRCSHPEQGWAPEALHRPAPTKPSSHGHTANNASGGGAHLVAHTSVRKFGEWGGGGCRSTKNLSTAAEMGGAARREGKRYAPADALPEAPASWH